MAYVRDRGWLTGFLALATACGDGEVGLSDLSDQQGDEVVGTTGEVDGEVGGETDASDVGAQADDSGGDEGSAAPDDTGGRLLPQCDLVCENGSCILADDGPECSCERGFASVGLGCIPCVPAMELEGIDVPLVEVTGTLLINGMPPPQSPYETGALELRNRITGDVALLGTTDQGEFSQTLIPGTYDVFYAHREGRVSVPANTGAKLATLEIDNLEPLMIDIAMATVEGTVTVGGMEPPGSIYERGRVELRDPLSGDVVRLTTTNRPTFSVLVIPGTYDVYFVHEAGTVGVPRNPSVLLETVELTAAGDGEVQRFDIDIPIQPVTGEFRIAGAAPPGSPYETGRITLETPADGGGPGETIELGLTHEGTFTTVLVPGTYRAYYSRVTGGASVPLNRHALIGEVEVGPSPLVIDVPMVDLRGAFTVARESPSRSPSDDAVLRLENPETGDLVTLGNTHDGAYQVNVVPGTYDLIYSQETSSVSVPANTAAHLGTFPIEGGLLDVDVPVVTVTGTVTLNGVIPPDSEYDDGRLYLRNRVTGDSVLLGSTREPTYERLVVPGPYDVVYSVETPGPSLPINGDANILQGVMIDGTAPLDIDLSPRPIGGPVTLGGLAPPSNTAEQGAVFLDDVLTADPILIGTTTAANSVGAISVTAGRYLMRYRTVTTEGALPANTNAAFACVDLASQAADSTADVSATAPGS